MMLFIPLLVGQAGGGTDAVPLFVAKVAAIMALVFAGAKWIVPRVFYGIARTRSRELFLLGVIAVCMAVAWLTHLAGLSLALGAFLAGLILSESEYSQQALGNILPFRDVFTSFFFVSIGMLLDMGFFFSRPLSLAGLALGVLAFKSFIAGFVALILGMPLRSAILVGLSLGQVGEFSFILAEDAIPYGLLSGDMNQGFLAVSVLTMMATPFALAAAPRIASRALKLPLPRKIKQGSYPAPRSLKAHEKDHLIVVGFGLNGRNLARAARFSGIPYVVIEMNPTVVKEERAKGEPIYYGDATQEAILQHANIRSARAVVVVINDPAATRRITEAVRRLNPKVYLVVRTRFLQEMAPLSELGANEVIPEEFETSIEIFARVLHRYQIPRSFILDQIEKIRGGSYEILRRADLPVKSLTEKCEIISDFDIETYLIDEHTHASGRSLKDLRIHSEIDATVIAVRRGEEVIPNPEPDFIFKSGDVVYLIGKREKVCNALDLLDTPPE